MLRLVTVPLLVSPLVSGSLIIPQFGRGSASRSVFTPLKNDDHPCVAENLKESHRYICDDEANVICLSGWAEPEDDDLRDLRNPCPIPICDFNGDTCVHGECVRPDVCACEVGWEGHLCDSCIPLPGCQHGTCSNYTFECNCDTNEFGIPMWQGAFCDQPSCPNCHPANGFCFEPFKCECNEGWIGEDCMTCLPLPGCVHGQCEMDKPNTCQCDEGWQGHLCDQPICSFGCHEEHGFCTEPDTCICKPGWEGPSCDECVKYWSCPLFNTTCIEPNQCICEINDPSPYCNRELINGPLLATEPGSCSERCVVFSAYDIGPRQPMGVRVTPCNWGQDIGLCTPVIEDCYGTREWSFDMMATDELNFETCTYNPTPFVTSGPTPP